MEYNQQKTETRNDFEPDLVQTFKLKLWSNQVLNIISWKGNNLIVPPVRKKTVNPKLSYNKSVKVIIPCS